VVKKKSNKGKKLAEAVDVVSPVERAGPPTKYTKAVEPSSPVERAGPPTKYTRDQDSFSAEIHPSVSLLQAQVERRLFEASVEEVITGFLSLVNRTLPDASIDAQVEMVSALVSQFGQQSLRLQRALMESASDLEEH
jgi:hypothetical protein